MSCDVGKAREGLENELWCRWSDGKQSSFSNISITSPTSQLILQPFHRFAHSPTFPSLHLHYSPFSNPSVASPTSQLVLQSFFCFSYITGSSLTSPGEPPMFQSCAAHSIPEATVPLEPNNLIHCVLHDSVVCFLLFHRLYLLENTSSFSPFLRCRGRTVFKILIELCSTTISIGFSFWLRVHCKIQFTAGP